MGQSFSQYLEETRCLYFKHAKPHIEALVFQYIKSRGRYAGFYELPARTEVGEDCVTTFVEENMPPIYPEEYAVNLGGPDLRSMVIQILKDMESLGLIAQRAGSECQYLSVTDRGRNLLDKQGAKQEKEPSLREIPSRELEHVDR